MIELTEDNRVVHGLWIGNKLSTLELLTINSFIANGHEFWLWAYNKLENNIPTQVILKDANEIIIENKIFSYQNRNQYGHGKGSYAGFSDIFRYALLYKYGGWWTDMDITCLKPLNFSENYVFRNHHIFPVVGNLMKCPKDSILMYNCLTEARNTMNSENTNWNKPIEILNNNIEKLGLKENIKTLSPPDKWRVIRKLLDAQYNISQDHYVIHWINEEWRRLKIDKSNIIENSLYHNLLKKYNVDYNLSKGYNKLKNKCKLTVIYSAFKLLTASPKAFIKALFQFK